MNYCASLEHFWKNIVTTPKCTCILHFGVSRGNLLKMIVAFKIAKVWPEIFLHQPKCEIPERILWKRMKRTLCKDLIWRDLWSIRLPSQTDESLIISSGRNIKSSKSVRHFSNLVSLLKPRKRSLIYIRINGRSVPLHDRWSIDKLSADDVDLTSGCRQALDDCCNPWL